MRDGILIALAIIAPLVIGWIIGRILGGKDEP